MVDSNLEDLRKEFTELKAKVDALSDALEDVHRDLDLISLSIVKVLQNYREGR